MSPLSIRIASSLLLTLVLAVPPVLSQVKYDFDVSLNVPVLAGGKTEPTGFVDYDGKITPSLSLGITRYFQLGRDYFLITGLGYRRYRAEVNYVIHTRLFALDAIVDEQNIVARSSALYLRLGLRKQISDRIGIYAHFDLAQGTSYSELIGYENHSTFALGWIPYITDEIVDNASFAATSYGNTNRFASEGHLMIGADYRITDRLFAHLSAQYNVLSTTGGSTGHHIHYLRAYTKHQYVTNRETISQYSSLSSKYFALQIGVNYVIARYKD